jgi:type IV secretion system protein VirB4
LFELGLGEVALAFAAASSKADQGLIERVLAEHGSEGFVTGWLGARDIGWACDLIPQLAKERGL